MQKIFLWTLLLLHFRSKNRNFVCTSIVSKPLCSPIDQLSSFKIIFYPHPSIIKFQNNSVPSWINYQVSKSFCICINQFSSFKIIFISVVRFKCFQTIYRQYEINTSVAIPNWILPMPTNSSQMFSHYLLSSLKKFFICITLKTSKKFVVLF